MALQTVEDVMRIHVGVKSGESGELTQLASAFDPASGSACAFPPTSLSTLRPANIIALIPHGPFLGKTFVLASIRPSSPVQPLTWRGHAFASIISSRGSKGVLPNRLLALHGLHSRRRTCLPSCIAHTPRQCHLLAHSMRQSIFLGQLVL